MGYAPTMTQIEILMFLFDNDYSLIMKSASIQDINEGLTYDNTRSAPSDTAIRNAVDTLLYYGLVSCGMKIGTKYTFYITEKGSTFLAQAQGKTLKELIKERDSVKK